MYTCKLSGTIQMAHILTFTTRKGGGGKSTLAVHLLGALLNEKPSAKVLVIDTDPQGDLSNFILDRKSVGLPVPALSNQSTNIKRQSEMYDYVLIDLAGKDSKEAINVLRATDIAIIPVRPSQFDLNSLGYWLGRIEQEKEENPNLKSLLVINAANSSSNELKETKEALKSVEDYVTFARVVVKDRTAYRRSISKQLTAHEWNNHQAKAEISVLLKNIIELIK